MKFVIESDDEETRRALARLALGPPFEIITAPPIGPRTKPKALNVALPWRAAPIQSCMTPRTALNPISSAAQSICSAGTADTIVLDLIVLRRRGLLRHARVLVLTPLHWFRLSLAAWRALFQLLYDPEPGEDRAWPGEIFAPCRNARRRANRNALRPRALAPIAPIGPMMIMKSARGLIP